MTQAVIAVPLMASSHITRLKQIYGHAEKSKQRSASSAASFSMQAGIRVPGGVFYRLCRVLNGSIAVITQPMVLTLCHLSSFQ